MLSRHFDLPFRRDVLNRILSDQLKRSGQGDLPIQAIAAVCDLLGLRTTGLQPNTPDLLSRVPALLDTDQWAPCCFVANAPTTAADWRSSCWAAMG